MPRATSFTFGHYEVDARRSRITCKYRVGFEDGTEQTFSDQLSFPDVPHGAWEKVLPEVLEPTLRALLIMLGINYWCAFPTRNIHIEGFSLTREQARFWDTLYLNGLAEFFYDMQMDFKDLIAFPSDASLEAPVPARFPRPSRSLLLNGAGKDSVLSAEMLKAAGTPFDFFSFAPTPAHARIAKIVGDRTIGVTRKRDHRLKTTMARYRVSSAYPSVSTFTFIAVLLAEVLGYDRIVFSNERSADIGTSSTRAFPSITSGANRPKQRDSSTTTYGVTSRPTSRARRYCVSSASSRSCGASCSIRSICARSRAAIPTSGCRASSNTCRARRIGARSVRSVSSSLRVTRHFYRRGKW